jgi:Flp pilus assembly protein TadD
VVAPARGEPWRRTVDLRVDDHPEPLAELDRLLDLSDAYALATEGDELVGQGRHEEAGERYRNASALAPGNHELLFWAGLAAAQAGDMPTALQRVREAIRLQPGWRELLDRLEPDIAPGAAAVRAAL